MCTKLRDTAKCVSSGDARGDVEEVLGDRSGGVAFNPVNIAASKYVAVLGMRVDSTLGPVNVRPCWDICDNGKVEGRGENIDLGLSGNVILKMLGKVRD